MKKYVVVFESNGNYDLDAYQGFTAVFTDKLAAKAYAMDRVMSRPGIKFYVAKLKKV